jgi:hypothetical protein
MDGMQPATGTTPGGSPAGCLGPGSIIIFMIAGVIPGGNFIGGVLWANTGAASIATEIAARSILLRNMSLYSLIGS